MTRSNRIAPESLKSKVMSAEDAASLIHNGAVVGDEWFHRLGLPQGNSARTGRTDRAATMRRGNPFG